MRIMHAPSAYAPTQARFSGLANRPAHIALSAPIAAAPTPVQFGKRFGTRDTGIVATLGPATNTEEKIRALAEAGVNVFRLNFSHGDQPTHGQSIQVIRKVEKELKAAGKIKRLRILADMQGPKIRVGKLLNEPMMLKQDDIVHLSRQDTSGEPGTIPVSFPEMIDALRTGQNVLLADGTMKLEVMVPATAQDDRVTCKVVLGGPLSSKKGINLPGVTLSRTSAMSDKDKSDMAFAVKNGVDWVALSFVRNAQDMREARAYLDTLQPSAGNSAGKPVRLFAKIEKPEAVVPDTLHQIVTLADGVMVARGDLGVELQEDIDRLPGLQEAIIREAKSQNKRVIVATQMLESMMNNPNVPSRSDVADIADAVKDHTDFTMLSGETSIGNYPVEAVKMMSRIITRYEPDRGLIGFVRRTVQEFRLLLGEWLNGLQHGKSDV